MPLFIRSLTRRFWIQAASALTGTAAVHRVYAVPNPQTNVPDARDVSAIYRQGLR